MYMYVYVDFQLDSNGTDLKQLPDLLIHKGNQFRSCRGDLAA